MQQYKGEELRKVSVGVRIIYTMYRGRLFLARVYNPATLVDTYVHRVHVCQASLKIHTHTLHARELNFNAAAQPRTQHKLHVGLWT